MSIEPPSEQSRPAHVVVFGNEKGGAGTSTTAMHVIVALLRARQRVATIDLDSRQKSLTQYVENRRAWARHRRIKLELPTHHCVACAEGSSVEAEEAAQAEDFAQAVAAVESDHDFLIIDTPGADNDLVRLGYAMADTLITPLNDSSVDFDGLAIVDPATSQVVKESHYAEMVLDARRQRQAIDGVSPDWVVVRNRLSMSGSRNERLVGDGLGDLALRLGFRIADGIGERAVYRALFPRGLTALDDLDEATLGTRPNMSHVSAREEAVQLLAGLRLPLSERGRGRAADRAPWLEEAGKPLESHHILAEAQAGSRARPHCLKGSASPD